MKREQALRRQIASLGTLEDAVNAMKSLSAHHLRVARKELDSARQYRDGIDRLIASSGFEQDIPSSTIPAVLLFASDLGLCDGYNQRLVELALAERRAEPGLLYCVGRRPLPMLRRAGVEVTRSYAAATSVAGLPRVLLDLADEVLGGYMRGDFGKLVVISARFDGVGVFTPLSTGVLPLSPVSAGATRAATPYASPRALRRAAVREYLYSTLYELLLDALAAEHGTRLVATGSAGSWLDDQISRLGRLLAGVRQETGTQEVLDVASGARMRRRTQTLT
jgi:F-type H+-transporting ATPase subunit gamma